MEKQGKKWNGWQTEFDDQNGTMTHTFGEHLKVVLTWNTRTIRVLKDGKLISEEVFDRDTYTLKDYYTLLTNTAKAEAQL